MNRNSDSQEEKEFTLRLFGGQSGLKEATEFFKQKRNIQSLDVFLAFWCNLVHDRQTESLDTMKGLHNLSYAYCTGLEHRFIKSLITFQKQKMAIVRQHQK